MSGMRKQTVINMSSGELAMLLEQVDAYLDLPDLYEWADARAALKAVIKEVDPCYVADNMQAVHDL